MANDLVNYKEKFLAAAASYADEEPVVEGSFLSIRGGVLQLGEDALVGNQLCCIILDSVRENTYYDTKFDPNSNLPPKCFAFARREEDLFPHEAMQRSDYFEPQNVDKNGDVDGCDGCPMNEFGSADTGRGKACGNRRRLALIPAGMYTKSKGSKDLDLSIMDDPDDYAQSDMAFLKVPVTSTKAYAKYVQHLTSEYNLPPFGVITRIYVEPDPKTQFKVMFEVIETLPDDLQEVVYKRHLEARKSIIQPYAPPTQEQLEPRARKGRLRRA